VKLEGQKPLGNVLTNTRDSNSCAAAAALAAAVGIGKTSTAEHPCMPNSARDLHPYASTATTCSDVPVNITGDGSYRAVLRGLVLRSGWRLARSTVVALATFAAGADIGILSLATGAGGGGAGGAGGGGGAGGAGGSGGFSLCVCARRRRA